MRARIYQFALCLLAVGNLVAQTKRPIPPVIPVGLDAYRQWERWPYQRIGARAYMRSTYDRSGGNEGADASHFLYQLADDFNVSLDVEGPGVLYFARYNHWHGSPWHYVVDGVDHIIEESSTVDPLHPAENSAFIPTKPVSKSAGLDVVAHTGRRPHVGPDPVPAFFPDGILPDTLRNGLLHLPPVCPWREICRGQFVRWDRNRYRTRRCWRSLAAPEAISRHVPVLPKAWRRSRGAARRGDASR
jgi:hypothetical protein